jgi:hypothetical protein
MTDISFGTCPSFVNSISPALCNAVDNYCERTDASILSEPVNALANVAFIFAAWFAWRAFRRANAPRDDILLVLIIAMIPVVGLGSFAFHTLAVRWAEWADVLPILAFMLLYLWLAWRRYYGWSAWPTALGLLVFFLATFGIEAMVPARILWGGAMYLPIVLALSAMVFAPISKRARSSIVMAVGVFFVSYTFRTLDTPLCSSLPLGTHFLWHCLNAFLLYLLVRAALFHRAGLGQRDDLAGI